MEFSLMLGILSFAISIIAIGITIKSDRMMKSIANLEYDEKLAIMASHSEKIKTDKSLGFLERIKNDFSAVSNLQVYANSKRKEKLIEDYIIPIVETVLNDSNLRSECAVVISEIIDIALGYGIATDRIKNLRQRLRGK
ncbi:MAG: hypothetical protein O8C62_05740 [Candidatus Methanoperedens sp.]|nr:hypothetical protein [Candidatus Methanoperedens sp.]